IPRCHREIESAMSRQINKSFSTKYAQSGSDAFSRRAEAVPKMPHEPKFRCCCAANKVAIYAIRIAGGEHNFLVLSV
ncbi:hypothetical protein Q4577_23595, partial [Marinovum sp. 2_MG-2023]|uniref:hypothetical protein n=1 Tax=unclassified Marinovum TaxID=2647166 RepID=UPI0026E492C4